MRAARSILVSLIVACLVPAAATTAEAREKTTYVLVHGAFHGGWAWQALADELRNGSTRVYTPTLSGLGEREHLARPDIDLETHIQDVVNLIEFEDLHDVILVGHSYAGIVITGVAARVPERIAKLVYFDAVVPDPGQSFFSSIGFDQPVPPELWDFPSFPAEFFGLDDAAALEYVRRHLTPQPIETFRQPIDFQWDALAGIEKSYIHCLRPWFAYEPFLTFRARALANGWDYYEIDAGHDAMITATSDARRILKWIAHSQGAGRRLAE